jgi:putative peptide zinc metalloprotease protein
MSSPTPQSLSEKLGTACVSLRNDLEFCRHVNRDGVEYVVRDPVSFQHHSFSVEDYHVLCRLNDREPLGALFKSLVADGVLDEDQQNEFYDFVLSLHRTGLLSLPISDEKTLIRRLEQLQEARKKKWLTVLFSAQIPLMNPDRLVTRTLVFFSWLFTLPVLIAWGLLMVGVVSVIVIRWNDLMHSFSGLFQVETLLSMWVAMVLLKVWHEMGHAYACKRLGGIVPETGVMLMVLTPCAYVDASASWSFPRRRDRLMVCLGGMYFESFVAAVALFVWASTSPSWINDFAYQLFFLSSVVTLGFNLNPLMRFDGYYVLSDAVGIPNLRQRAADYTNAILARVALGVKSIPTGISRGLGSFFFIFSTASGLYRISVVLGICTVIAMKFYYVGLVLAAAYVLGTVAGMLTKLLKYLWFSIDTADIRGRAVAVSVVLLVVVPAALMLVPVPWHRMQTGVVSATDVTTINAEIAGVIQPMQMRVGDQVDAGASLAEISNPEVNARQLAARATALGAEARWAQASSDSPTAQRIAAAELESARRSLQNAESEADRLNVRTSKDAVVTRVYGLDTQGRFVKPGEPIITIASGRKRVILMLDEVTLNEASIVKGQEIECRAASHVGTLLRGIVVDIAESASIEVRSSALSMAHGGPVPVAQDGKKTALPSYVVTIELVGATPDLMIDEHVYVRLPDQTRTLAQSMYRAFLRFRDRIHVAEGQWGQMTAAQ